MSKIQTVGRMIYITSDKAEFTSMDRAQEHQATIDLAGELRGCGYFQWRDMTAYEVAEFILSKYTIKTK